MKRFIHDVYSSLSHIPDIGDGEWQRRPMGAASWVDDADARRLEAYKVLASYGDNTRRYWLPDAMWARGIDRSEENPELWRLADQAVAAKLREYGDAGLLIDTGRALVLGDDQTIVFPDLAQPGDADGPAVPDRARIETARDWLDDWATRVRLLQHLVLQEEHTIGQGDGVIALGWDPVRKRPVPRAYDPGFWFPDLASADWVEGWDDPFPPIQHLAWEREEGTGPDKVTFLRRTTWWMQRLPAPVPAPWGGVREWTCWYAVAEWRVDNLNGESIYRLRPEQNRGRYITEPVDLQVDFVPVVHVPQDEPGDRFFGRSLLMRVAHILDDLSGSDTDLAVASETLGTSPAVFTGASAPSVPAGPAQTWNLPAGASAALLDTSRALVAGISQNDRLLARLAVNSRFALALLGQISPKDVPSGYALQLGFAPAAQLRREMRAVRAEKHQLLLKFALRMAQAGGVLEKGPTPDVVLELGASLPSDRAVVVDEVKALRSITPLPAISLATAVRMLAATGIPIEDAEAEVAAIERESWERAIGIVDATGDVAAGREALGLPAAAPAPVPEPEVPPAPAPEPSVPPTSEDT